MSKPLGRSLSARHASNDYDPSNRLSQHGGGGVGSKAQDGVKGYRASENSERKNSTSAELPPQRIARDAHMNTNNPHDNGPTPPRSMSKYDAVNHLSDKVKALEGQLNETQSDYVRVLDDLNRLRKDRNSGVADDQLATMWEALRYQVKNWTAEHLDTRTKHAPGKSDLEPNLKRIVSSGELYLDAGLDISLVGQSLIWEILRVKIFSTDIGWIWTGKLKETLDILHTSIAPRTWNITTTSEQLECREYMRWRATTANYIMKKIGLDQEVEAAAERLVQDIGSVLSRYLDLTDEAISKLRDHVRKAIRIDIQLAQQRARFVALNHFEGRQHNFCFDEEYMVHNGDIQDIGVAGIPSVQLVLSPALIKAGTSDGENYNESTCVVKAHVQIHQKPVSPAPRTSFQNWSRPTAVSLHDVPEPSFQASRESIPTKARGGSPNKHSPTKPSSSMNQVYNNSQNTTAAQESRPHEVRGQNGRPQDSVPQDHRTQEVRVQESSKPDSRQQQSRSHSTKGQEGNPAHPPNDDNGYKLQRWLVRTFKPSGSGERTTKMPDKLRHQAASAGVQGLAPKRRR